jgi:DNA-binding NtrC family response regulator
MEKDHRPRIIIVEDDDDARTCFAEALALAPALGRAVDITKAASCAEARDAAEEARDRLALVLLDRRLPDGDGLDFTAEVHRRWPRATVILLTADSSPHTAASSRRLGVPRLLVKPVRLDELTSCVTSALASSGHLG